MIQLWQAIKQMEDISKADGSFSLSFRKYDDQRNNGGDLVKLSKVRLRPKTSDSKIKNSSYKLFFTDLETGQPLNCWQLLIVEFNGNKIFI